MSTPTSNGVAEQPENTEVAVPDPEPVLKHPLNTVWSLWYFINDKNVRWEDSQVKVASFSTVEDFWALFNHIESASRLRVGCDYSLFKDEIKPMWEDAMNITGGKWSLSLNKSQRNTDLDKLWMETIMLLVGENMEEELTKQITGAVISVRPRLDRLAVWTGNHKKADLCMKIGHSMRDALNVPPNMPLEYTIHQDNSKRKGSSIRALYTV